jgi:hypothetical protein
MAEQALYSNTHEPQFPFDRIRSQLSWLPSFLSAHLSDRDFDEPLLNTILVFTRARTAALLHMGNWDKVSQFAKSLNSAAEKIRASHHKLELFRVEGMFFVTTQRSPRFHWKLPMTHNDIGRNLDYFAPGHNMCAESRRCGIFFIEKRSLRQLTAEVVLSQVLEDPSVYDTFEKYNATRVKLFNFSMTQLGLDYRFKCVVMTDGTLDYVAEVMTAPNPPLPDWWDNYCYFVNGWQYPGVLPLPTLSFVGYDTNYNSFWPIIQLTFHFVIGYNHHEYCSEREYLNSIQNILERIRDLCKQASAKDLNAVMRDVEESFKVLAESAENQAGPVKFIKRFRPSKRSRIYNLQQNYHSITRLCYMCLFKRFKLRPRLVRSGPSSSLGDQVVFR